MASMVTVTLFITMATNEYHKFGKCALHSDSFIVEVVSSSLALFKFNLVKDTKKVEEKKQR